MTTSILKTKPQTRTGLNSLGSDQDRQQLGQQVLRILSSTYVLMTKTQAVHWNVSGPLFKSVHDLTEDQYTDLFEAIDDLAERIRALGLRAPMNYAAMQNGTDLEAFEGKPISAGDMLRALAADNELIASELVQVIKAASEKGDPATEDLFTERLRIHQKNTWMLRAMIAE